ncbi:hypothetical protein CHX27_12490 [Flavobacterium aurantiibacter]|uniref:Uncharacterized protein n=1 Tax=Flavobacterium aurantiibacter TaxID=2023067 RepID=A0A255ZLA4_9FLAO|nr:hypothetical protein CHX27_12490 [Flavobacterium aurantiibacter]
MIFVLRFSCVKDSSGINCGQKGFGTDKGKRPTEACPSVVPKAFDQIYISEWPDGKNSKPQ